MNKKERTVIQFLNNKLITFAGLIIVGLLVIIALVLYKPRLPFEDDDDSSMGIRNNRHTARLFGDFINEESKKYFDLFVKYCQQDPTKISFIYKNFPAEANQTSQELALVSECAHQQGFFWEVAQTFTQYQFLFTTYKMENQSAKEIYSQLLAKIKNFDLNAFNQCYQNKGAFNALQKDLKEAKALRLDTQPAAFIDNQRMESVEQAEEVLTNLFK